MLRLYPEQSSVRQGDTLILRVSSSAARFRIKLYRQAAQWVGPVLQSPDFTGASVPLGPADSDFGWPAYVIGIPANFESGVYMAVVEPVSVHKTGDIPPDAAGESAALFVVTSANPGTDAKILYKLPLFTYHAYNLTGDPADCFYTGDIWHKVTLRRPGGGAGAIPWDSWAPDDYDPTSPRQTYRHWDQKFVMWLEANGYAVDYCTDLDVHQNPGNFLERYNLILSVGHDEYWSEDLRNHLEQFRDSGGNIAFFSGNTCWWRVHLADGDTAMICDKSHRPDGSQIDQWWNGAAARPENGITGVSYRNGNGWWSGKREPVGYTVQYPQHWVFDGVVRADGSPIDAGDVIGGKANQALVGYECDGAALGGVTPEGHVTAAGTDGTPASFQILGLGRLSPGWQDHPAWDSAATMGVYDRGGTVFTAATTDWARLLDDPQVDRITRNVLDHLANRHVKILGLGGACSASPAVEGATLNFHVDISGLPNSGSLTFAWTSSAGNPQASSNSTFKLTLPSPPESVTVSVTLSDAQGEIAFGSLTFLPLTIAEAKWMEFVCRLFRLAKLATRRSPIARGVGDRHWPFVDPLWDPLRGLAIRPLPPQSMKEAVPIVQEMHKLIKGLGNAP